MDFVEGLKRKEEVALIELMKEYGNYLTRTAYLLLKDQQLAEEAVQDTFITAFEKINQLANPEKLRSWLTSILINRCRSYQRKRSWKHAFLPLSLIEPFKEEQRFESPEDQFFNLLEHQELSSAIHELEYKYREVIILFYFNEMKIHEISHYLKANENTIKSRLTRGRSQLKQILQRGEGEYEQGERKNERTAR